MIQECLDVFRDELDKKGPKLILDDYIPAAGTYLIVAKDGRIIENVDIRMDKKTNTLIAGQSSFRDICNYDYQSRLVSMNKPVDSKKVIHSNNYLSFWVKKDSIVSGKLTEEIIDGYYDVLKNPLEKKYKKTKEASRICKMFEEMEGAPPEEEIEKKRIWIKEHIFALNDVVDFSRKDYLKIFFKEDNALYEKEGRRYFLPNIYNSNDYNIEIENRIYGLPDNNLGMNAKKPLLSFKTRKYPASYLLDSDKVLFQKQFFDLLMNFASARKYNIYVDTAAREINGFENGKAPDSMESGYYIRIQKGKNEAEIQNQDNITDYKTKMEPKFNFEPILGAKYDKHREYGDKYGTYDSRIQVGELINTVFFSNYLSGNYYVNVSEITINDEILKQSVILARDAIFDWVYKGIDRGFQNILEKVSINLIKGNLLNRYRERVLWQLDLRYSFRNYFSGGKINMAETISGIKESLKLKIRAKETIPLENDDEYFYAVGQLAAYLISLNRSKDRNQSLLNPFLNAKSDVMIKSRILQLYKKYNYSISDMDRRVKNLLALVEGYIPDGKIDQEMIILGYACDNLIYMKEEK